MSIMEVSVWLPAILIELTLVSLALALFMRHRALHMQDALRLKVEELEEEVEHAKAEARRIEQEALRKRKIVTFEDEDIVAMLDAGEMEGNAETLERLKSGFEQAGEVLTSISASAAELNARLAEVMERQMEAVNMVGRLGGTGGLPPEVKEKAEAILDVFRTMDEVLSVAYEDTDKLETGLAEVVAAVADFKKSDPKVKLPTAEGLNALLRKKSGVPAPEVDEDEQNLEDDDHMPPPHAFDEEDEIRL